MGLTISNPNTGSGGGSSEYAEYHVGAGKTYSTAADAVTAAVNAGETDAILVIHENLNEHVQLSVENFSAIKSGFTSEVCSVYIDRLTINGDSNRAFVREGVGVIGVNGEDTVHVDGDATLVFYNAIDGLKLINGLPDGTHAPGRILFQRHPGSNISYRKSLLVKINALDPSEKGALEYRGTVNTDEETTVQTPSNMVAKFANSPYTLSDVVDGPVEVGQTLVGDTSGAEGSVEEVIDNYVIFSSVTGVFQDEGFSSGVPTGNISIETTASHEIKNGSTINGQIRGRVTSDFYGENSKFDADSPIFDINSDAVLNLRKCTLIGDGGDVVTGDGNLIHEDTNFRGGTLDSNLTITNNSEKGFLTNGNILVGDNDGLANERGFLKSEVFNSGDLAGNGGSVNINRVIGKDKILVKYATIQRTAGTADTVRVLLYTKDDFVDVSNAIFGEEYSGMTIGADLVHGPFVMAGGSTITVPLVNVDLDGTGEIHLQIINDDFTPDNGTFEVTLYYEELE